MFNTDGSYSFNPGSDFDALAIGESRNVTFTYTATDNNGDVSDAATVTITINGTNDAATVSSASEVLTETDAVLTSSGTLTSTDVDDSDNAFTPSSTTGIIGGFAIDATGNWTFTANSTFDSLDETQSVNETFNVTSVDGTPSTVTITINGTNDAATVSSANETLTETDVALTTSGTLTSVDVDDADNAFTPSSTAGTIGDFSIDVAGAWTFTANSAFDNLNVGDNVNETFNVTSIDGTPSTVTITINGTNDAAMVSSANETLTETDAALTTSGTLTSVDVDDADNAFTPNSTSGTIGDFSIDAAGAWTFTANSQLLANLKELDIRIAIDDFGTGFSSLTYLLNLPLDTLKIDQSFIKDIHIDKARLGVVRGILAIADSLNMQCLAEGVENPQQLEQLLEMGCCRFQGYLFSPPISATEFAERF